MLALSKHHDLGQLDDRLRDADAVTRELISEVVGQTCRRFPSMGQTEKTARIERLIGSEAWTDAALALIDLELPQWQVRRIAMTKANGIARSRASASFRNGSINRSKPIMPICRWRS